MSAPELSAAEAARVAKFDTAPAAAESWTGDEMRVAVRMAVETEMAIVVNRLATALGSGRATR